MSQDEIKTAATYSEEAYWDLIAAKKMLQFLRFESCDKDEEVFYLGRRALYLLQQASEKAIKAHLITYFKPFIEALMLPENAIDENTPEQILMIHKLIEDTANLITAKNLGHEPGITISKAMCNLYELRYKYVHTLNDYIRSRITTILQSALKNKAERNKDQDLVKEIVEAIIVSPLVRQYMNSIMIPEISAEEKHKLEKKCSEIRKASKQELFKSIAIPCIDKDMLRLLENIQKYFEERIVNEAKNQSTLQEIQDKVSSLLEEIIAIINFKETLVDEELKANIIRTIMNMINNELGARGKISILQQLSIHPSFVQYIIVYALTVDQCLALYERLGRYPGRTPESNEIIDKEIREAICRDIQTILKLVESIEYLVLKVRESMKTLQELKSDYLILLYNLFNFLEH
jgi:chorismate mutase